MKKVSFLLCVIAFMGFLAAEEEVTILGQHPFYKVRDMKVEDVKKMASEKAEDIQNGFDQIGYSALAKPFMEHVQSGEFELVEFAPGTKFRWMMFKKQKKVLVKSDMVWAGKKNLAAYKTTLYFDGSLYNFLIPVVCGNISLLDVMEVPKPVCALTVTPQEVEQGKPVQINVCTSSNTTKSIVTILNSNGDVVKTLELTPDDCRVEVTLDDPGEYAIQDEAEGKYGLKSAPCRATLTVVPPAAAVGPVAVQDDKGSRGVSSGRSHFIGDLGFAQMKDPTNFLFIRIGYQYRLSDDFHLNFLVGPWINLSNNFYKTPFAVDVTCSYFISDFFIGGGLGYWVVKDDNKADLILNAGYRVFAKEKLEGSIFLEGRMGFVDFKDKDQFSDFSRYGLGFRLVF